VSGHNSNWHGARLPAACANFLLLALLLTIRQAPAQVRYHLTDLGTLPGTVGSAALAINNRGHIVGYSVPPQWSNITARACMWLNGQIVDLSTPGQSSFATDINESGQVVIVGGDSHSQSAIYDASGMHPLPPLPTGEEFSPFKINDSGTIAGSASSDRNHAYVYSDGKYSAVGPGFGGDVSSAGAINNAGQMTGVGYNPDPHPFLYTPGTATRYIPSLSPDTQGQGQAINDAGDVVGDGYGFIPAHGRAFLYTHDGRLTELMAIANAYGSGAYARGINNLGQIVGHCGSEYGGIATLWSTSGVPVNLNTRLDESGRGWTIGLARAINDLGQIVGEGWFDPDGSGPIDRLNRAFLLTPLPALSVARSPAGITIAWPTNSLDLVLVQKDSLRDEAWTPVTDTPFLENGRNEVHLTLPPAGTRFFQLQSR
jgi:probable HAF family extracellular repeat protein